MKAFVCNEFGPVDIHKVEDVTEPELLDGQVLIDVKAAGVSFPEVLIVQGLYQFKPPFPFIPGGEVAGVISRIGMVLKVIKKVTGLWPCVETERWLRKLLHLLLC